MLGNLFDQDDATVSNGQAASGNTVGGRNTSALRKTSGKTVSGRNTGGRVDADRNPDAQGTSTPNSSDDNIVTDAPKLTRAGRAPRRPAHLRDYIID